LPAGPDLPGEDQPDLVRPADVEVLPDHLLEQHPARQRRIEHLSEAELDLQHRDVVAVAGDPVRPGERVRQPGQSLAQQRIDLGRAQPVADLLQPGRVAHEGQPLSNAVKPTPALAACRLAHSLPLMHSLAL
jgi:hypothetical protein